MPLPEIGPKYLEIPPSCISHAVEWVVNPKPELQIDGIVPKSSRQQGSGSLRTRPEDLAASTNLHRRAGLNHGRFQPAHEHEYFCH